MKNVIVTGANGFIGTHLLEIMSSKGIHIYAIIKNQNEDIRKIKNISGVQIIYCSLEEIEKLPQLISDREIDTCIHLAWAGSFGGDRANYFLQLKNVEYSLKTVDVIAKMGIRRFVGAGTLAEKDVLSYHLLNGATPNAVSLYGCAKVAAHLMTKAECSKCGIEHIWCYLSNTYGVGNTTNNFVNMACRLMLDGKDANFTSGEQSYDFVYITDTVQAIFAVANQGKPNTSYYLGSGKALKLKDYIRMIRDAIDPKIELHLGSIQYNGNPLPQDAYDTTKLTEDTGFQAKVSFEKGIRWTVEWLRTEKS